jgi:DNA-binding MarR family transcriptional regulator
MHSPQPPITETTLICVDGLIIDQRTGEFHGYHSNSSVFAGSIKYQSELGKCRSADDFRDYLRFVDRRKLPPHELHSLQDTVNYAHGRWRRSGVDCRITLPQQRLLEKLHSLVLYRNVIFMTQADLAKDLGIAESNLMKKLRVLIDANMLKVRTSRDGIRTGEIMLLINPRLVFRGSAKTKARYTHEWYRPVSSLNDGEAGSNNVTGGIAIAA